MINIRLLFITLCILSFVSINGQPNVPIVWDYNLKKVEHLATEPITVHGILYGNDARLRLRSYEDTAIDITDSYERRDFLIFNDSLFIRLLE